MSARPSFPEIEEMVRYHFRTDYRARSLFVDHLLPFIELPENSEEIIRDLEVQLKATEEELSDARGRLKIARQTLAELADELED